MNKKLLSICCYIAIISVNFLIFAAESISSPRLLIKIPTRGQKEQFFNVLDHYFANLSKNTEAVFLISCDLDDSTMNNPQTREKLKRYPNLVFKFGATKNIVDAYNRDIQDIIDFDILLVANDNALPVKNFDQKIINLMKTNFPNFDGVIHFNDGHSGPLLNTIPVIGRAFYNRFGYIYHPSYNSSYHDYELTLVSKILCKSHYSDEIIIKRQIARSKNIFYLNGLRRDNPYVIDKENFKERQSRSFDLPVNKISYPFKLSIILMDKKSHTFRQTYHELQEQRRELKLENDIEILVLQNDENLSCSQQKNLLLNMSVGEYICFVETGIHVMPNYLKTIVEHLDKKPDCLSLTGLKENLDCKKIFIQSCQFKSINHQDQIIELPLNHLNPIRRSIAIQFSFLEEPDQDNRSKALYQSELLKNELRITTPYVKSL